MRAVHELNCATCIVICECACAWLAAAGSRPRTQRRRVSLARVTFACIHPLRFPLTPSTSTPLWRRACCCPALHPLLHAFPLAEPSLLDNARRQLGSSSRGHTYPNIALVLTLFCCIRHTLPQLWSQGSRSSHACPPHRHRTSILYLTLLRQSTATRFLRARIASTHQTSARHLHST